MKKLLLVLVSVVLLYVPVAWSQPVSGDGHGTFLFQAVMMQDNPPPQWSIGWFRPGLKIDVEVESMLNPEGKIVIIGWLKEYNLLIKFVFNTDGVIFHPIGNGIQWITFNATGDFCIYEDERGRDVSVQCYDDDPCLESGGAYMDGRLLLNTKTMTGKFFQTYIRGGHYGFLIRGMMNGSLTIQEGVE